MPSERDKTSENPYEAPRLPTKRAVSRFSLPVLFGVSLFLLTLPISGFLILDGITFAYHADYGCYTIVEGLLGLRERAGVLRPVELIVGLALVPTVATICLWRFRKSNL